MKNLIYLLLVLLLTASCKKNEPEKFYLNAVIKFNDVDNFPKNNTIQLELYKSENDKFSDFAFEIEKPKGTNTAELKAEIKAEQFGEYIAKISIVETPVRKIELVNYGVVNINKTVNLPMQTIKIATLTRIKQKIFNKCTMCHGKNVERIAAGLNLMPDSCYSNLINVKSKNSTLLRVKPYEPQNSFIVKVLNKEIDFEHSASTNVWGIEKELIENWILDGAEN